MKTKLFSLALALCWLPMALVAQSIERNVVGSAGASASDANVSIDYTLGETVVLTVSNSNNTLTQGFHQPASVSVSVAEVSNYTYSVFPNPFNDMVQVELQLASASTVQIRLVDLYGRVVYSQEMATMNAGPHLLPLDTKDFAAGSYLLSVCVAEHNKNLPTISTRQLSLVR